MDYKGADFKGQKYTIQVAPEDCTGCGICVAVCPAKDKSNPKHKAIDMAAQVPLRAAEAENFKFFLNLPEPDRTLLKNDVKGTQFMEPLFEFSGACAGCGETPYIKLMTQLFGDRALIANATGCSSIYGGNLPTTPYTMNADGRGPAWANSLFEDNAEFGLGFRLALDKHNEHATRDPADPGRHGGRRTGRRHRSTPTRPPKPGSRPSASGSSSCKDKLAALGTARSQAALAPGRLPGQEVRVDPRRRRLGLRHRLRRPRSRHGLRPQREHPGPGHRGLLQHRRPGLQVHPHRRRGEVRHGRQVAAQEGPGHDRHGLRQRLRGQGGHGRQGRAGGQGLPGSRKLRRTVASSSPTATASPTATTWSRAASSRSWRWIPATGRCSATTPAASRRAKARCRWIPPPPRSTWAAYVRNETRYRMVEQQNPEHFKHLLAMAQREVTNRYATYENLAHLTMPVNTVAAEEALDAKK